MSVKIYGAARAIRIVCAGRGGLGDDFPWQTAIPKTMASVALAIASRQGQRALQKVGVAIRPVVPAGVIGKYPMRLCSLRW
jgi:hypothetical protein